MFAAKGGGGRGGLLLLGKEGEGGKAVEGIMYFDILLYQRPTFLQGIQ